jgi:hypothetical protein
VSGVEEQVGPQVEQESDVSPRRPTMADLFLFAPLGLVIGATASLPDRLRAGQAEYRKQAVTARFVGKMVLAQQRRTRLRPVVAKVATEPEVGQRPESDRLISKAAEVPSVVMPSNTRIDASSLPIDGYDTLPARSVMGLLEALSLDELQLIDSYEQANRQRATILHRVAQLVAERSV